MLPSVVLEGRLVADVELRFTAGGKAVAKLRVACNQRVKRGDTYEDGETTFLDVVVWEGKAENAAETLNKGDLVMVSGRLSQRSWETTAGEKRVTYEVTADVIGPALSGKSMGAKAAADAWGAQSQQPPF